MVPTSHYRATATQAVMNRRHLLALTLLTLLGAKALAALRDLSLRDPSTLFFSTTIQLAAALQTLSTLLNGLDALLLFIITLIVADATLIAKNLAKYARTPNEFGFLLFLFGLASTEIDLTDPANILFLITATFLFCITFLRREHIPLLLLILLGLLLLAGGSVLLIGAE